MALNIDEDGTIFIHQGDSGEIVVSGISTDNDYTVYFAVQDKNRNTIGSELSVQSNYQSYVTFVLSGSFTDLLTVPDDDDFAVYHYGLKMCTDDTTEDTLFVVNYDYGQPNNIIVFPKKVEGT
ncbi:MAG: hypothetical protein LUB59_05620 [Candidatus Gastranaerophilales bacterium]|nr:hypothetical protein [Candidatus Gastranaerophilales bacterium]